MTFFDSDQDLMTQELTPGFTPVCLYVYVGKWRAANGGGGEGVREMFLKGIGLEEYLDLGRFQQSDIQVGS